MEELSDLPSAVSTVRLIEEFHASPLSQPTDVVQGGAFALGDHATVNREWW